MNAKVWTIRHVLEQLQTEDHINSTTLFELRNAQKTEFSSLSTPWYVRVLIGFSAWVAAILLLVFLFGTHLIDSEEAAMVFGIIFITLTTTIRCHLDHLFSNQFLLAISLAGQALLVFGLGEMFDSGSITASLMLLVELLLIWLYHDTIQRFLSTVASVVAIVILLYILDIPDTIHLLILPTAFGAWGIWQHSSSLFAGKLAPYVIPVGYGITISLLGLLTPSVLPNFPVTTWWISTFGLMLALLMGEHTILAFHRIYTTDRISVTVYIATLLLTIPLLMAPGILAALLVLILGFHRGNRILTGLALVFLVVFLGAFYYHLHLTLLAKSGILTASGALLLIVRFFINRQAPPPQNIKHETS